MDTVRMTREELENNYEYKVTKRILMKEYPWIKDVLIREDEINKYNIIFLDLVVDPFEAAEMYGWDVAWYVRKRANDRFSSPYLSTLMEDGDGPREIVNNMEETMKDINQSTAIPSDIKLPEGRKLLPGSWITTGKTT